MCVRFEKLVPFHIMKRKNITLQAMGALLLLNLSCVFSPDTGEKTRKPPPQWVEPTTPRKVIKNLEVAFTQLDIDFYERCLHENFYYRSPSDIDEFDIYWSRPVEIETMRKLFAECREFIFTPSEINIYEEYGKNVPNKPDGAIIDENDEHPDDIWIVCDYYITMDIFFKTLGDYKVQQDMKFIMVEDPETHLFSIIRWVDDTQITE